MSRDVSCETISPADSSLGDSWLFVVSSILILVHFDGMLNEVMHEAGSCSPDGRRGMKYAKALTVKH